MTKIKVPTKYLPSLNKIKDMQKQVKMLMKSRKQYKKGKFFTRKNVKSYKSKPSNHITDAKKRRARKRAYTSTYIKRSAGFIGLWKSVYKYDYTCA